MERNNIKENVVRFVVASSIALGIGAEATSVYSQDRLTSTPSPTSELTPEVTPEQTPDVFTEFASTQDRLAFSWNYEYQEGDVININGDTISVTRDGVTATVPIIKQTISGSIPRMGTPVNEVYFLNEVAFFRGSGIYLGYKNVEVQFENQEPEQGYALLVAVPNPFPSELEGSTVIIEIAVADPQELPSQVGYGYNGVESTYTNEVFQQMAQTRVGTQISFDFSGFPSRDQILRIAKENYNLNENECIELPYCNYQLTHNMPSNYSTSNDYYNSLSNRTANNILVTDTKTPVIKVFQLGTIINNGFGQQDFTPYD